MVNNTLWSNIRSLAALKKNCREIGHLRFKVRIGTRPTITINLASRSIKITSLLTLSKIGDIRIRLHRPIAGKVKAVLVKKSGNKWYVIV